MPLIMQDRSIARMKATSILRDSLTEIDVSDETSLHSKKHVTYNWRSSCCIYRLSRVRSDEDCRIQKVRIGSVPCP
jgi:hypothetical protein